jgi:hypothetical protein
MLGSVSGSAQGRSRKVADLPARYGHLLAAPEGLTDLNYGPVYIQLLTTMLTKIVQICKGGTCFANVLREMPCTHLDIFRRTLGDIVLRTHRRRTNVNLFRARRRRISTPPRRTASATGIVPWATGRARHRPRKPEPSTRDACVESGLLQLCHAYFSCHGIHPRSLSTNLKEACSS